MEEVIVTISPEELKEVFITVSRNLMVVESWEATEYSPHRRLL